MTSTLREEVFRGFATQAQQEHVGEDSHNYQTWLEGAMVKGMRPLYKAIRSQETVLVRPFRDNGPKFGAAKKSLPRQSYLTFNNEPLRKLKG